MSNLLMARADLLEMVKEARVTLADMEYDIYDGHSLTEKEIIDTIEGVRDNLTVVISELDSEFEDYWGGEDECEE
jgi:hypothetical protein